MLTIVPLIALALTQVVDAGISPRLSLTTPESLSPQLDALLARSEIADAEVSVHVVRISDNKVLYAKNENTLRVPASTIKLFTTAAAIDTLGPDYRFETELYGPAPSNGVVHGDLYLVGNGDPWLVPERLWYFANRLKYAGITTIEGDLIVDDSYFEGSMIAAGLEQDSSSSAYMAPAGALSVGFNAVLVHVLPTKPGEPAQIAIEPPSENTVVLGTVTTSERTRTRVDVDVLHENGKNVVKVSGYILQSDKRGYWRRIHEPAIHSGAVYKRMLSNIGVTIRGAIKKGSAPAAGPGEVVEPLVAMSSPRLADLMEKVNKYSNNFMSGQLARATGAKALGAPGSWVKAEQTILEFLARKVQLSAPLPIIKNASGLHDVNQVSTRHVTELLTYMAKEPRFGIEFMNSMAVAGGTGTLQSRMNEGKAHQVLRAKTGTLSIASALSGYVTTENGERLAFSMLVNHFNHGIQPIWDIQNELGEILASMAPKPVSQAQLNPTKN